MSNELIGGRVMRSCALVIVEGEGEGTGKDLYEQSPEGKWTGKFPYRKLEPGYR